MRALTRKAKDLADRWDNEARTVDPAVSALKLPAATIHAAVLRKAATELRAAFNLPGKESAK